MKKDEKEILDPFVVAGLVLKIKISDFGRLESLIQDRLFEPKIIYVEKVSSNRKLKIVEEEEKEEMRNERNGKNNYSY